MRKLVLLIIISSVLILLSGCANIDVAKQANEHENYQKAYKIYTKWAEKGYGNANKQLALLAIKDQDNNNSAFIIKNASIAYYKNIKYSAIILESLYYEQHSYQKALQWLEHVDLNNSRQADFQMHISLIVNHLDSFRKQNIYLNKFETFAKNGNYRAAYSLGELYQNKHYQFYNLDKSKFFFTISWKLQHIPSGIKLALLYINKFHSFNRGFKILQDISGKDDGQAAYIIANLLYEKMKKQLHTLNSPCFSIHFTTIQDYYIQKEQIYFYKKKYMKKNIIPWYKYSYQKGYTKAKLKLITIDLQNNYSKMTLKEVIKFLKSIQSFRSKLILAKIYEIHLELNKQNESEKIYEEYKNYDKVTAYWHLYKFNKKFHPFKEIEKNYLEYLVQHQFLPAILEKAYINQNKKILKFYADKNNINALTLLNHLYLKENFSMDNIHILNIYEKLCTLTEVPHPKLNMKIANWYLKTGRYQDIIKSASIYKYYADKNNTQAQLSLANIYSKQKDIKQSAFWLHKADELGNIDAKFSYASLVLTNKINADISHSIKTLELFADKNNTKAMSILGDIYAKGLVVEFNFNQAMDYYIKAVQVGDFSVYLHIANLYKTVNYSTRLNHKIIDIYKQAIEKNVPESNLLLANFYISILNYNAAKKILKQFLYTNNPEVKYLLYKITHNRKYLDTLDDKKTNYGPILLSKGKLLKDKKPRKALLYTFRATLCNVHASALFAYKLMKKINNSVLIQNIYNNAKKYPICSNNSRDINE